MSSRSERAQRRAARVRNQRIGVIVILVLVIASGAFLAFGGINRIKGAIGIQEATPIVTPSLVTYPSPDQTAIGIQESTPIVTSLQIQDEVVGSGQEAITGDTVSVHYTGWLLDGKKFDSSLDRGEPFEFVLGQGNVIQGWDQGVVGMKVGGKRKLTIPADLAYGAQGIGSVIPPDSALIFEVELLAIK